MSNLANESGFHTDMNTKLVGSLASKLSWYVRKKMYLIFERKFHSCKNVLDVGVTSESVAPEANYFEELFPFKDKITAAGIEDANHLEKKYKGLKFVKITEGNRLPFDDNQFEVSFSNAVIEHIVDDYEREKFISELLRVSDSVFLTTPNKYFPFELHTGVPLIHFFLPGLFNYLLDKKIISKFYNSNNLKLLGYKDIQAITKRLDRNYQIIPVYLFGFVSNWIIIIDKKS